MQANQKRHIETVLQVAETGRPVPQALHHDEIIRDSWMRCVHEHKLDPTRMQEAIILPGQRIRERQDQLEEFLHIARHGLETLYQQVAGLGYAVLAEAALGFIGVGVTPPTPTWGNMLQAAFPFLEKQPALSVAPGVAIFLLVLAFNLLGDALRDILDPRLRGVVR